MKAIILHIGRHKSGTSSLQKFLYKNAEQLRYFGYEYSLNNIKSGFAHHDFAKLMQNKFHKNKSISESVGELQQSIIQFKSNLSSERVNVVSSEAFQNCNPELIRRCFDGFDVKVCFYLRNEIDYLQSSYLQKIHASNYSESIDIYANNFNVNYEKFLTTWKDVFDTVECRVFDRTLLNKGDVVSDFVLNFLKVETADHFLSTNENSNPSLTNKYYQLKTYINKFWTIKENYDRNLYKALGELSNIDAKSGGEKFKLPIHIIDKVKMGGNLSSVGWQNKIFGKEVFKYDQVGGDNDFLTEIELFQALAELESYLGTKIEQIGLLNETT